MDPLYFRAIPCPFILIGTAIYAHLGTRLRLGAGYLFLYALFPFLLNLFFFVGFYSNDAPAFLGGAFCCLAAHHWLAPNPRSHRALCFFLLGLTLASVKLTSLLLAALFTASLCLLHLAPCKQLSWPAYAASAAWFCCLLLPYVVFWQQYGSPVPDTQGQRDMMAAFGTTAPAHAMGFARFCLAMLPRLADQSTDPEITGLPLLWFLASIASLFCIPRIRGVAATRSDGITPVATATAFATFATLTIHLLFVYQRYISYGWGVGDINLRYYFPLLPAYGQLALAATYGTVKSLLERSNAS